MPSTRLRDFIKAYDVRGLVPEQLDERVVHAIGAAFAEIIVAPEGGRRVIVGHDMRDTSPALASAFGAGVQDAGLDVMFIGLCSTDGLYYASGDHAAAGAMITASHNPATYNGIKLCRPQARPVSDESGLGAVRDRAQDALDGVRAFSAPAQRGSREDVDLLADYGRFLRSLVDLRSIRPLRVVIDAGNGMAGHTVPAVLGTAAGLEALPLSIEPLFFELDGTFPNHEANPLDPANLVDLQAAVQASGADCGLAFDGDADRCFLVDENAQPVSASAVTALVALREIDRERARLATRGSTETPIRIVHNVITSAAVAELVREAGAEPVRSRVGHSYMKADMAANDAIFGGEHSAHYYFRDFWFADTGMLAAMHALAALGSSELSLSELTATLERYVASGEINSVVTDAAGATTRVRQWALERGAELDDLDGLTARHTDGSEALEWWVNVRASNTEPLLRLNVEARDRGTMEHVRDSVLTIIREAGET